MSVVGREQDTQTPPKVTKLTPNTAGLTKNINDRLSSFGYSGVISNINVSTDEVIGSLTVAQKKQVAKILDKAGFTVRTLTEVDAALAQIFPSIDSFTGFPDLLNQLSEQLIVGGKKEQPSVTRQIQKYDEDVLKEVAQSIAIKKQGAMLNDAELADAVALANSIAEKGTVTETKRVRNPKTGKLENVVTTKPGFSQERFSVELGKQLEEQNPLQVERRKAFDFMDEMSKILSGGM